jgi:mono/diheme cytochrome c family protein
MTWRVILGTLSFVITMILFGYVAVTEQDRMATFDTAYQARQIETGGQLFESNCATCHGLDGKGTGRAPALNTPELLAGDPPARLTEAGWGGTLQDFIHSTVAGGRPQASAKFAQYPERMPTWSQEFGGPMRTDQVDAVVAYVLNWAPAYANVTPEAPPTVVPVGTDITAELPAGDAAAGEAAATTAGCTACHISWRRGHAGPGLARRQRPQRPGHRHARQPAPRRGRLCRRRHHARAVSVRVDRRPRCLHRARQRYLRA